VAGGGVGSEGQLNGGVGGRLAIGATGVLTPKATIAKQPNNDNNNNNNEKLLFIIIFLLFSLSLFLRW